MRKSFPAHSYCTSLLFLAATFATACSSTDSPKQANGATPGGPSPSADGGVGGGGGNGGVDGGGSDGGKKVQVSSEVFPRGLFVASPFAESHGASLQGNSAGGGNVVLDTPPSPPGPPPPGGSPPGGDEPLSFAEAREVIEGLLSPSSETDCQVQIPIPRFGAQLTCYGPSLSYEAHPDGDCTTSPGYNPSNGCIFPGGDLGIWSATEGSSGRACTAAKLNSDLSFIGGWANATIFSAASMACIAAVRGVAMPEVGHNLDLTSALSTALAARTPGLTVTSAVVEQDADGYVYAIAISFNGSSASLHLRHEGHTGPFAGKIWGSNNDSNNFVFSLNYELASASSLRYQLTAVNAGTDPSSVLSSDGDIDPASNWSGNMSRTTSEIDPSTGLGKHSYAWQAGHGDDSSRVFNVYTESSGASEVGCGYFGYGDKFGPTFPDAKVKKFICNWAGAGNSHSGIADGSQKQCMTKDGSGVWIPTSNAIAYSPQNSCANSGSTFRGGSFGSNPSTWSAFSPSSELVSLASDSDYAAKYGTGPTPPAAH